VIPCRHADRGLVTVASRFAMAFLLCQVAIVPACADGLVFKLPVDGTIAKFREETSFVSRVVLSDGQEKILTASELLLAPKEQKIECTVTIRSVGKERQALQDCRWIELSRETSIAGGPPNKHVLKLLVPEEYLTRGKHPLDHTLLTFFNAKERDQGQRQSPEGFNRIDYETDRFLPIFPPPLTNERRLASTTIETKTGMFRECEVITGTTEFDRPLLGDGRWAFKSEWRISLHADAPFGVVELRSKSQGREIRDDGFYVELKSHSVLTLSEVGADAKGTPIEELRGN
jgi:hypothetical protein